MRRFFRYTLVGVGTFLLDLALLYFLTSILVIPYYISTPAAFLTAVSVNYAISRTWVFVGTARLWHHGYTYFIGIALGGAAATTLLVVLLVTQFGLYYLIARAAVAGLIGLAGYFVNLYWNFKVAGKNLNTYPNVNV